MIVNFQFFTWTIYQLRVTREQHVEYIKSVIKKIKECGFMLSEQKCEFFLPKVKYLGQIAYKNGRQFDTSRTNSKEYVPTSANILIYQAYFCLANY